mgnify:CR=1 FL=1
MIIIEIILWLLLVLPLQVAAYLRAVPLISWIILGLLFIKVITSSKSLNK